MCIPNYAELLICHATACSATGSSINEGGGGGGAGGGAAEGGRFGTREKIVTQPRDLELGAECERRREDTDVGSWVHSPPKVLSAFPQICKPIREFDRHAPLARSLRSSDSGFLCTPSVLSPIKKSIGLPNMHYLCATKLYIIYLVQNHCYLLFQ